MTNWLPKSNGDPIAVLKSAVEFRLRFPDLGKLLRLAGFSRAAMMSRSAKPFRPICARMSTTRFEARTNRVEVHHASLIDFLKTQPAGSLHRYVLLDAQDWMTPDVLTALWSEIDRTADARDARVIFRTAGEKSPLPRKLPPELLAPWDYLESASRAFHARDKSSIYGGSMCIAGDR